jgi:hypothetical protein
VSQFVIKKKSGLTGSNRLFLISNLLLQELFCRHYYKKQMPEDFKNLLLIKSSKFGALIALLPFQRVKEGRFNHGSFNKKCCSQNN